MRDNPLVALLAGGRPIAATMITDLAQPETVRALAVAGFDLVAVDNEHAPTSLERNALLYREACAAGISMLVRVPDAAYHLIARTLDAGADGVMVPRVETVEQARAVVEAAKYPPLGRRGCGQRPIYTRLAPTPILPYIEHLNRNTTVMIQVESAQAVEHLDELLAVGGIDIALIGPADLSISLGVPGQMEHPRMLEAVERVVASCRRAGVCPGIHAHEAPYMVRMRDMGMRALMYLTDVGMLTQAARRAREELGF